ncbi:MAG: cation:proton antiporter [candidate division Zixibacteria bacterium]|nr:cation:proton antiporter [candidate division Zixibacteria bacterium]
MNLLPLSIIASAIGLFVISTPSEVFAAADEDGGVVLEVLLGLIVILIAAKLGGDLFERFKQPAVLGELFFGILIGNAYLFGFTGFEAFKTDLTLEILAEIGVIILLFQVGLESTVKDMLKVGPTALLVAVVGVVAPFLLGLGVTELIAPNESIYVHIFVAATLTATSVGITARVLKDIGKSQSPEAKIILGAAVIDDILGLVILSTVVAVIAAANGGGGVSVGAISWIVAKAGLFIAGAIIIGSFVVPYFFRFGFVLKGRGVMLSFSLLFCFVLAYISGLVGLAPIVGAFAAGLVLEKVHFRDFVSRGEQEVDHLIEPIATFLVPIFFVRMGMQVDLMTFANGEVLWFAAALTVVAVVGKQVCSLVIFDKTINRLAIGLGMIPRGEVGLIFAGIGARLTIGAEPVVSAATYSAVVIMVIVTTLVTPPLLKWALMRGEK